MRSDHYCRGFRHRMEVMMFHAGNWPAELSGAGRRLQTRRLKFARLFGITGRHPAPRGDR